MELTKEEINQLNLDDFPFPQRVIENTIKSLNKALLLRDKQITREEFKARAKRILSCYRDVILRLGLLNEILDDGKENVFIFDCVNDKLALVAVWTEDKESYLAQVGIIPGVYEMFLASKVPDEES